MKVKSGPHKGKEIEFASVSRVEAAGQVADGFMFEIFEFEAGDYLITDESSLTDFVEYGSADTEPLWKLVEANFGVSATDVGSDKLVDIIETIIAKRNPQ
ncbi:MAG: hypothetical protein WD772_01570 [Pseudohongiellaceae bacterium]